MLRETEFTMGRYIISELLFGGNPYSSCKKNSVGFFGGHFFCLAISGVGVYKGFFSDHMINR